MFLPLYYYLYCYHHHVYPDEFPTKYDPILSAAKTMSLPVTYKQYYHKLAEHAMIKLVAICNVKETSYAWVGDDRMEVLKPDLKVEVGKNQN